MVAPAPVLQPAPWLADNPLEAAWPPPTIMLNHPNPQQRPAVLIYLWTASIALPAFVAALSWVLVTQSAERGWLWSGMIGGWWILMSAMMALSWSALRAVRGGPPRGRSLVVHSGDFTLLASLAAIAVAMATFVLGALDALVHGAADSPLAAWILIGLLGAVGLVCAAGAIAVAHQLIRRGRSRLVLESSPVPFGVPFKAILEIPFATHDAPDVHVTTTLLRSEQSVSNDDSPTQRVLWTGTERVIAWQGCGKRRSRAPVTFELPEGLTWDADPERTSHVCSMVVEPFSPDLAWKAEFTLPIDDEASPAAAPQALPDSESGTSARAA